MTVLGFLIVLLIVSLGKMYFFNDPQKWKASPENNLFHQEHFFHELDDVQEIKQQEWAHMKEK